MVQTANTPHTPPHLDHNAHLIFTLVVTAQVTSVVYVMVSGVCRLPLVFQQVTLLSSFLPFIETATWHIYCCVRNYYKIKLSE